VGRAELRSVDGRRLDDLGEQLTEIAIVVALDVRSAPPAGFDSRVRRNPTMAKAINKSKTNAVIQWRNFIKSASQTNVARNAFSRRSVLP